MYIFSKESFHYISGNGNPPPPPLPEKFLMFQEMELSYISGNRIPKKLFVLQKVTFRTQKIKTLKKTYIPPPKKKLNKTFLYS